METRTKIFIGIAGALTLGLVAYFTRGLWMPKKGTGLEPLSDTATTTTTGPATTTQSAPTPNPTKATTEPTPNNTGTTTPATKNVYANKDGVNVYSIYDGNKVLKTAKKGEWLGTLQGVKSKDASFINSTMGKAWVTNTLVTVK